MHMINSGDMVAEVKFNDFAFEQVNDFSLPKRTGEILMQTRAFAVMSLVAGGKGTICNYLREWDICEPTTSHTTRDPEIRDGLDPENPTESSPRPDSYHFVDMPHMVGKMLAGEMLEVAKVHNQLYGTSLDSLEAVAHRNKRPVLDIDIQGVTNLREHAPFFPNFFLVTKDVPTWIQRWSGRDGNTINRQKFDDRITSARKEADSALNMSFSWETTLVVNDDARVAAREIADLLVNEKPISSEAAQLTLAHFVEELQETPDDNLWESFQQAA